MSGEMAKQGICELEKLAVAVTDATAERESLEQILVTLTRHGKPSVSHLGTGWYCKVKMHVSSTGIEFNVASEFGHSTPSAAAAECSVRVVRALRDLGA